MISCLPHTREHGATPAAALEIAATAQVGSDSDAASHTRKPGSNPSAETSVDGPINLFTPTPRPSWLPKSFAGGARMFPDRDTLLLPYQSRWVLDRSRKRLCEKSRQIGFTWATAYDLVRDKGQTGHQTDAWITSRDEVQARLFIQDLRNWAGVLDIGAQDLGQVVVDDEKKRSAFALHFATGATAYSLSSNPDAQAGKRGDRVADEFALHADPRLLYTIMMPGITWGGRVSIFSTHRGTANFFNALIQEIRHKGNPKGFSLHRVTLVDALQQGFLFKLQSKLPTDDPRQAFDEAAYYDSIRNECADMESFLQEYMCVPGDDASAFISFDLISACKYAATDRWELSHDDIAASRSEFYLGVDVGRRKDLTAFWLIERTGGRLLTRLVRVFKATPFAEQREFLYSLLRIDSVRRCCIDSSGLGMQLAEEAEIAFRGKVEGITFTNSIKEKLAYPLKAAFEDRVIRIPDDRRIESHLRAISKETTLSGNTRFAADRGPDGHADLFWAPALALHAAKDQGSGYSSTLITPADQGWMSFTA